MRRVNIIHLSDIHFDSSEDMENLLSELENDLKERKKENTNYHLMVITGDIIDKGEVVNYENFSKKLNEICKGIGISHKHVLMTIGNHDIDCLNSYLQILKKEFSNSNSQIDNLIYSLDGLYSQYNAFNAKYCAMKNGIGIKDYIFKDENRHKIMKLRFIVLNSGWSVALGKKYGELVIGDFQLNYIKNELKKKNAGCEYIFLCMHHPLDWFCYEDREKIKEFMENERVDFLIHGHIHTSEMRTIGTVDKMTYDLCTGIAYRPGVKYKEGMRYSIYQIDNDTKTMNVIIRSTNKKGKFVDDNSLYSEVKNGFFVIPLEKLNACLLPFKSADEFSRSYLVATKDNVENILEKERNLYMISSQLKERIKTIYAKNNAQQSNEFKDYKKLWLKKQQIDEKDVLHSQKTRLLNDFRTEQFGLFCQELLINLNTFLFDENEETNVIRILLRKYNKEKHEHQAYLADGINSAKTENITNFKWKTGLIYRSFIQKAALLQSANLKYYEHGKPDKWRNSLTIAIDGITIKIHNEEVPLLSLNIAIISQDCEKILEALALSSIYQTLEEIFTFYSKRVYDIRQIIYPEDKK